MQYLNIRSNISPNIIVEKIKPTVLKVKGIEAIYDQELPIQQHNRTGTNGQTTNNIYLDDQGQLSLVGTVKLKQLGSMKDGATPIVICGSCFYFET